MARPTKLTPETQAKIVQALKLGATYQHACNYAGIHYDSLREWILKAERGEGAVYSEFSEAVQKAQGAATIGWLAKIEKAADDGNWTAAAWKLERCYPDDYGKRTNIQLSKKDLEAEYSAILEALDEPEEGGSDCAACPGACGDEGKGD